MDRYRNLNACFAAIKVKRNISFVYCCFFTNKERSMNMSFRNHVNFQIRDFKQRKNEIHDFTQRKSAVHESRKNLISRFLTKKKLISQFTQQKIAIHSFSKTYWWTHLLSPRNFSMLGSSTFLNIISVEPPVVQNYIHTGVQDSKKSIIQNIS